MKTYAVREITEYIKDLFDADRTLGSVWVQGEVSRLTRARSGHWYFTIKDAHAQLSCVMFRSAASRVSIDVSPGAEILVHGKVGVYVARGEYQLVADMVEAVGGIGDLHRQFEDLKRKLDAEGLFDGERKQAIPSFPKRIGVVTSPTAAAWQDIQTVLSRRMPLVEVLLSPSLVQGSEAPAQIVRALQRLYRRDVDVILLARGGGSLEDLWCFNDEAVARTVAASPIPVISGVGHEIDFTIVDFVVDLRAPTPSAAAEQATPNRDDLLQDIDRLRMRLAQELGDAIGLHSRELANLQGRLRWLTPSKRIEADSRGLADLRGRQERAISSTLARLHERLSSRERALDTANPLHILGRGYALVIDERGEIIRRAAQVSAGQRLDIQLADDTIKVKVDE
ncbi:MAG: exodeoxyribonuclease VII large subunit [Chloroflexi bacterium]|nr:exodeoxyribonuclease VII large subunit [Chloroflexota bacterium]MCY3581186.1 exodeoxyribonuclease VII large subunit [Chloroflexota bacterium]MCY3716784.1 exodeoxyribonuclease VII large subunit [Chloroflexota bacterium]MDE2649151.1 exodeoxyribonuclease VII large subunit [Chloroflexota bacterium]MXV92515.1 exodeoxyribonuclease VII large subunit [Chloroflexota bacterium]